MDPSTQSGQSCVLPLPLDLGRNPYPGRSLFNDTSSAPSLSLFVRVRFTVQKLTIMSSLYVYEREETEEYTLKGEKCPPAALPPPPSSLLYLLSSKSAALQSPKLAVELPAVGETKHKQCQTLFVVLLSRLSYKMASLNRKQ